MSSWIHRILDARDYRRHQRREKRAAMAEMKKLRRRYTKNRREEQHRRFREFIANPFAGKKLTQDELDVQRIIRQYKLERKEARKKWLRSFLKNPYRTLFPKKQLSGDMMKIIRQSKIDKKTSAREWRQSAFSNLKKLFTTPDLRSRIANVLIVSTAYYILSFLLVYVVYQVVTIIVATNFKIPVEWTYYRVRFPLSRDSYLYTRTALIFIFGSGPLSALVLTLLFLRLFYSNNPTSKSLKLFYVWGIISGLNMFFGAYLVGTFTRTDFIYTTEWLLMNNPFDFREMILSSACIVVMLVAGWQITPMFLVSSGSLTLVSSENRLFLILSQVILPWILGVLVFFLVNTPKHYIPFFLKTITPGLILIPSLFTFNSVRNNTILEMGMIRRTYFRWGIVIIALILILLYRIVLNFGIRTDQ
jgi:hypothetical protein